MCFLVYLSIYYSPLWGDQVSYVKTSSTLPVEGKHFLDKNKVLLNILTHTLVYNIYILCDQIIKIISRVTKQ